MKKHTMFHYLNKMKTGKPIYILAFSFILIIGFVVFVSSLDANVSSLDAKIGNGRMILREEVGKTIDKTIRVINDNDFSVKIEMSSGGDLSDSIEIIDKNFILAANSEKNARFKINVRKVGEKQGTINVKFIPENIEDGKNGAALASTIILIGLGNGDIPDYPDDPGNPQNPDDPGNQDDSKEPFKFNPAYYLLIVTVVIFIVLVLLLVMYSKNNKSMNINETFDKKEEMRKDRVRIIKPKKRVQKQ